jgi:hypothetical protein
MKELTKRKKRALRIVVGAVLALGLFWSAQGFITESEEERLVKPFGDKLSFPDPPEKVRDILGALEEAIPTRESQEEDAEEDRGIHWVLPQVTERVKEKVVEGPKELIREKTIEVLRELVEKLISEESTKEKVCDEVCKEVCEEVCQ